jgi:hypothetical protein
MHKQLKIINGLVISFILLLAFSGTCQTSHAEEFVGFLEIRYPNQLVKTLLQGPYSSKKRCENLNQTTLDNALIACGSCNIENNFCISEREVPEIYSKVLRKEKSAFPYIIATPKGRIIISGIPMQSAIAECRYIAEKFRSNGYGDARCVLP